MCCCTNGQGHGTSASRPCPFLSIVELAIKTHESCFTTFPVFMADCLHGCNRGRLKEMQGVKKKSKAGQQRAEDRAEQSRSFPRAARPLGMQKQRKSADEAGLCHTCFQYSSNGTNQHGPTLLQQCMHQIWPVRMCSAIIKDKVTRLNQTKVYSVTSLQTPCLR